MVLDVCKVDGVTTAKLYFDIKSLLDVEQLLGEVHALGHQTFSNLSEIYRVMMIHV